MSISNLSDSLNIKKQHKCIEPLIFNSFQLMDDFGNSVKSQNYSDYAHSNNSFHDEDQQNFIKDEIQQDTFMNENLHPPIFPQLQKKRSARIEDQAIIVVDQQYELASSHGEESIILENIRFDYPQAENTFANINKDCLHTPFNNIQYSDQQNYSDSQCDFSKSELKINVRKSKNTCVDRAEKAEFEEKERCLKTNKSCIAKTMNQEEYKGQEPSIEYLHKGLANNIQIQMDSFCQTQAQNKSIISKLTEEITILQSRVQYFDKIVQAKDRQIEILKNKVAKNGQYEQIIERQHKIIKDYEQTQNQIKFSKLGSTLYYSNPAPYGKNPQSLKIFESSLQTNTHKSCRQQVQQLQEYIFDIEQKLAMISLQVQKRIQQVRQELQKQYNSIIESLKTNIKNMQQASKRVEQGYRIKQGLLRDREIQMNKVHESFIKKSYVQSTQQKSTIRAVQHSAILSPREKRRNYMPQSFIQKRQKFPSKITQYNNPQIKNEKKYSKEPMPQNRQLLLISNKIQRLRYQINKQLQSIN